jgi:hypothetical protein
VNLSGRGRYRTFTSSLDDAKESTLVSTANYCAVNQERLGGFRLPGNSNDQDFPALHIGQGVAFAGRDPVERARLQGRA